MGRLVLAAGGQVRKIRINCLVDQTFYAEIVVVGPHGEEVLDARPRDALAVAPHTRDPILAAAAVLDISAVTDLPPRDAPVAAQIAEAILAKWQRGRPFTAVTS